MTDTVGFLGFDVSSTQVVEVLGKIDPVPDGRYRVKVTSAERRVTNPDNSLDENVSKVLCITP